MTERGRCASARGRCRRRCRWSSFPGGGDVWQCLKQKCLEFPLFLRVGEFNSAVIVAAGLVVVTVGLSRGRGRVVEDVADFRSADPELRAHGRGELQSKRLLL